MSEEKDKFSHIKYAGTLWERVKEGSHSTRNVIDLASLESRLKEAEEAIAILDARVQTKIKELSQAEAENEKNAEEACELEKRLSNLMDVGGKLKSALEFCLNKEVFPQGVCEADKETEAYTRAKLALAEWDGIKEVK